jgi:hypothetical protein
MSNAARVTSIEAVQEFQAFLSELCHDAREALVSVSMEARRALDWVQHEQPEFWRRAIRDLQDELTQAKAELFQRQLSRMSGARPDLIEPKEAVWLAKQRLEEAEQKLENCRRWGIQLQRAIEEYEPPARQLAGIVEGDPPACIALLREILDRLDSYRFLAPPSAPPEQGSEATG